MQNYTINEDALEVISAFYQVNSNDFESIIETLNSYLNDHDFDKFTINYYYNFQDQTNELNKDNLNLLLAIFTYDYFKSKHTVDIVSEDIHAFLFKKLDITVDKEIIKHKTNMLFKSSLNLQNVYKLRIFYNEDTDRLVDYAINKNISILRNHENNLSLELFKIKLNFKKNKTVNITFTAIDLQDFINTLQENLNHYDTSNPSNEKKINFVKI